MLASNPRSNGKRMRAAHEHYAVARTSLLSDADKHIVASNGWSGALSESRGVAGILKTVVGTKSSIHPRNNSSNSAASKENIEAHNMGFVCKMLACAPGSLLMFS